LKTVFQPQGFNVYLQLSVYITAGGLTYLLVIGLAARSLCQQVLELVSLGVPRWKVKKM